MSDENRKVSVLTAPHWLTAFLGIAIIFYFVPFFVGFFLGFTVESDIVFGFYAMLSGLFADIVLRWRLKITLILFQRLQAPFIAFWILLCLYVIVFEPLR